MKELFNKINNISLVSKIFIGIVIGVALALISPSTAASMAFLGNLFVSALKAVAPILVFVLVMASIANQKSFGDTAMKPIIGLYLIGTLLAALVAASLSFLYPCHAHADD